MWKLSRYWNRLAFFVMRLGKAMIWDHGKRYQLYLGQLLDKGIKEGLTKIK